ncbi:MAG: hypothetical protein JKY23_04105 [Nitrospinaceae bacterium]|nr:hypothetical protein [Nitrospinaceae bacterium]
MSTLNVWHTSSLVAHIGTFLNSREWNKWRKTNHYFARLLVTRQCGPCSMYCPPIDEVRRYARRIRYLHFSYADINRSSSHFDLVADYILQCVNLEVLEIEDMGDRGVRCLDLSNCKRLLDLKLGGNLIYKIPVVSKCPLLKYLHLSETYLRDLSPLAGCINLQGLDLRDGAVCDITPLAMCVSLTGLDLSVTEVEDISALASCTNLQELNIEGAMVRSVAPLKACTKLRTLRMTYQAMPAHMIDVSLLLPCPCLSLITLCSSRTANLPTLVKGCKSLLVLANP